MSIRFHFLNAHLDEFPNNLGVVRDEQGERLQQDLKSMIYRYQGRRAKVMMADNCWSIMQDCPEEMYKRKFLPGYRLI